MKYCLVPNTETQWKPDGENAKPEHGPDILHCWLKNFHKEHDAEVRKLLCAEFISLADNITVSLPSPTL
jgi:hypothetical protein